MKKLTIVAVILFCYVSLSFGQEAEKKNAVYGEIACGNMYHGFDVGGDFFPHPTCKVWVNYDRKVTDRLTLTAGTWMQRAVDKPSPNGADEVDYAASASYRFPKNTSVSGSFGKYVVPNLSIHKYGLVVSHDFTAGKVPLTVSNEIAKFTTSNPSVAKGGIVNRTSLSTGRQVTETVNVSGGAALGIDAGPFGLNPNMDEGVTYMGFAWVRVEKRISKNFTLFGNIRDSMPIGGAPTFRKNIVSGDAGIAFRFEF